MKLSELKQLIKEEIYIALNEVNVYKSTGATKFKGNNKKADLSIPGASDSFDTDEEAKYFEKSLKAKGINAKVTVDLDEYLVKLENKADLKKAQQILSKLGFEAEII